MLIEYDSILRSQWIIDPSTNTGNDLDVIESSY